MRVIPGSYGLGQLPHEMTFDKDSLLRRGQRITVSVEESWAVELAPSPGEMSLHGTGIVHGSGANDTDDWRIACGMNILPTSVRHAARRESALLVRGSDRFGHFAPEPRPTADLDPAARAAYRIALDRMGVRRAR